VSYHNIPPVGRPPLLLVYVSCPDDSRFSIRQRTIPAIGIRCDKSTNHVDCFEATPYLNFLIDYYDEQLADRYFFAHAHDRCWHFRGSFFDQLEQVQKTPYYMNGTFGGLLNARWEGGACGGGALPTMTPIYDYVYNGTTMPQHPVVHNNHRPCCATFWMKAELVRMRKKEELIGIRDRYRKWAIEHQSKRPSANWWCSRVAEWTWHILLTNTTFIRAPVLGRDGNYR
jgi:hypothetical protein